MSEAKPAVLFVDDDDTVLAGLRRMLRGQRDQWEMTFVSDGRTALNTLEARHFDLVVSDMRMPDLDGATLLSEVERRHPGTVRIILSGYSEDGSILRTVGPAHQHLVKPCDGETIRAIMMRTVHLRRLLEQPDLRRLATGLRHLPSPPDLFQRLTEEIAGEGSSTASVAQLIAEDVAMTAELLKITNSAYFSFCTRICTVAQAVRLLGLEKVRGLVLCAGLFGRYSADAEIGPLVVRLNDHSLRVASLAQQLARRDRADDFRQDQAFCAGMLSGIGALVLLDAYPQRMRQILAQAGPSGWEAMERAGFGASHCELGAYLLGLWGFGDGLVEAVLFQRRPADCLHQGPSTLGYLHLAQALAGPSPLLGKAEAAPFDEAYLRRVGLKHLTDDAAA